MEGPKRLEIVNPLASVNRRVTYVLASGVASSICGRCMQCPSTVFYTYPLSLQFLVARELDVHRLAPRGQGWGTGYWDHATCTCDNRTTARVVYCSTKLHPKRITPEYELNTGICDITAEEGLVTDMFCLFDFFYYANCSNSPNPVQQCVAMSLYQITPEYVCKVRV